MPSSSGVTASGPSYESASYGMHMDSSEALGSMSTEASKGAMKSRGMGGGGGGEMLLSAAPMKKSMMSYKAAAPMGKSSMMDMGMEKSSMMEMAMDREFASYAIKNTKLAVDRHRARKKK